MFELFTQSLFKLSQIKQVLNQYIFQIIWLLFPLVLFAQNKDWVENQRTAWNIPGVVAVIAQKDKEPQIIAAGLCNIETQSPCTKSSQFQIGSNTKFFTSLLAVEIFQKQQIPLNAKLLKYWPELQLSDNRLEKLSLIDVLSQRSGIGSVDWPYYWNPMQTRQDLISRLKFIPMSAEFREGWSYSNTNFVIAGVLLEKLTAQTWESLLESYILKPLSITSYEFGHSSDNTKGYHFDEIEGFNPIKNVKEMAQGPAGSLVINGTAYGQFMNLLVNLGKLGDKQVLSTSTLHYVKRIYAPLAYDRRLFDMGPSGYALGLFVAIYNGDAIYFHSGGRLGFSSYFAWVPSKNIAVAVMTNANNEGVFPQLLALGLISKTLGNQFEINMDEWLKQNKAEKPPSTKIKTNQQSNRPLKHYIGQYDNPAWGEYEIFIKEQKLSIQYGQMTKILDHHNYNNFSFISAPGWERLYISFESDFNGEIDSFILSDGINPKPFIFKKQSL